MTKSGLTVELDDLVLDGVLKLACCRASDRDAWVADHQLFVVSRDRARDWTLIVTLDFLF